MTDERYCFMDDVKSRKQLASQAKYRKNGSRSKTCKMSYEYLTRKEQLKLNGECKTYKLGEPMTWEEFKALPEDKKELYFDFLNSLEARSHDVVAMFGINRSAYDNYMQKHNLPRLKNRSRTMSKKFEKWLKGFARETEINVEKEEPEYCRLSDWRQANDNIDPKKGWTYDSSKPDPYVIDAPSEEPSFSASIPGTQNWSIKDWACGPIGADADSNAYFMTIAPSFNNPFSQGSFDLHGNANDICAFLNMLMKDAGTFAVHFEISKEEENEE